jgi:hypothetical protein
VISADTDGNAFTDCAIEVNAECNIAAYAYLLRMANAGLIKFTTADAWYVA